MARKSARKHSPKKHHTSSKFNFNELLTNKHRPLHIAGLGTIMMFLQGLFALIGFLLVLGAAITYAIRAVKASK